MSRSCLKSVCARIGLLSTLLVLASSTNGYADQQEGLSAISFDFPGATNTQASAITPSGVIVGRYNGADGVLHGFLLAEGRFTSIDYPGAAYTDVDWINPSGEIGGGYNDDSTGVLHGFVLRHGQFTTNDYPGAVTSTVYGISVAGEIIGVWTGPQNRLQGYVEKDGHFTDVVFPGANATLPTMMAAGILVSGYFNASGSDGFEFVDGTYKTTDGRHGRLRGSARAGWGMAAIRRVSTSRLRRRSECRSDGFFFHRSTDLPLRFFLTFDRRTDG
jgi:hypothetical protein